MLLKALLTVAISLSIATACSTSTTTEATSTDSGGHAGAATGGASTQGAGGITNGGTVATGGVTSTGGELTCSAYCASVSANCLAETVKQYKSPESCMSSCGAFRLGTLNDTSGNTLGCRSHYATLAAAAPTANCAAAGPSGGGHCGTNCDAYCALMTTVCPSVFEDETLCRSDCLQMAGVGSTTYLAGASGDNVQCRIYHATFAAEGFPDVHCPHASPVPLAPCAN